MHLLCLFFWGEMKNSDEFERVKPSRTHTYTHILFSARSRASIVDGDAIVEKLNRSDGNSQPYTWPLAIYVYARVPDTFTNLPAYVVFSTYVHTYFFIRNTVHTKSDVYCASIRRFLSSHVKIYIDASDIFLQYLNFFYIFQHNLHQNS